MARFSFLILLLLGINSYAQSEINWMTWEQMIAQRDKDSIKKKVYIDLYTDWCGWCKKMERSTFSDPVIASYLNEIYYPVKMNGEQKTTIKFKDKEYKYVQSCRKGYHELAAWMMRGKMGYPTVTFIDENLEIIQPIQGYLSTEKFEPIMTYFGEDHHRKVPWNHYQKWVFVT